MCLLAAIYIKQQPGADQIVLVTNLIKSFRTKCEMIIVRDYVKVKLVHRLFHLPQRTNLYGGVQRVSYGFKGLKEIGKC